MLKSGEVFEQLGHLADYGLSVEGRAFDFGKVVERLRKIAKQLSSASPSWMRKHKIEVIDGTAKLEKACLRPGWWWRLKAGGSRTIRLRSQERRDPRHLARAARTIPAVGLEPDGERIWTYREAMAPKACPKSILVVGSGAIGIEFASFYRALGAEVTVIEALDRIPCAGRGRRRSPPPLQKAFERRGLKFRVAAKVTKLAKTKAGVSVAFESGDKAETLEAEAAIVAVGIDGNVENLGLEGRTARSLDRAM